jgi:hypothetical protein
MYREDGFMVRSSPVVWLCLARGTARRNQKRRAEHGHANRDAITVRPAFRRSPHRTSRDDLLGQVLKGRR